MPSELNPLSEALRIDSAQLSGGDLVMHLWDIPFTVEIPRLFAVLLS